jgi:Site-specific recombinase XerD
MTKSREDGDGSYREIVNKNGEITIEYTISAGKDVYGKRLRPKFYGKTKADCKRQSRQYLKKLGLEKVTLQEYNLAQWLDRWLKSYKGKRIPEGEKQIQQSTLDEYKKYAEMIKKHKISKVLLINIKPLMITDFFNDDLSEYSHTVIKKTRFLLNAAFEAAIENDCCYKNPLKNAAIPRKPQGQKEAFSDEDVRFMTEFAITDKDFGLCMILLLHSGMRSGELRAIGPHDINGRIISITKAIKESGDEGITKNGKLRSVPLKKDIAIIVTDKLKNYTKSFILGGDNYVGKDTLRSSYDAFFNRLNKARTEQGLKLIKRLSPHCCRHTYSTQRQREGVPMPIVAALLGHSALSVTEGYTHLDTIPDLIKAIDGD